MVGVFSSWGLWPGVFRFIWHGFFSPFFYHSCEALEEVMSDEI